MATSSLFSLMLFSFVLVNTFECSLAIKNVNIYHKYYIENSCTDNENVTFVLSGSGIYSVARIGAFRSDGSHFGSRNCTIVVKPPSGYFVYLQIETFKFGFSYGNSLACGSYIEISGNGTLPIKLCGARDELLATSYFTYGNMNILYHTGNDYRISGRGFTFIVTAYQMAPCVGYDYFLCGNRRCIWEGLTCDAIDNCGDSSDEMPFGNSQCFDIGPFTMKPIDISWEIPYPTSDIVTLRSSHNISLGAAVASAVFVILGAFIRFYCYYQCNQARRQQVLSNVTIIRARSALRQPSVNNAAAPPPYETLVNVPEGHPENPPEYTAVTAPPSAPCDRQNTTTPSLPASDKNANVSCGPPPPYEP